MTDSAPKLERLFDLEPVEGTCDLEVEGQIPPFLRGTYYLNGPARFRRGDLAYRHWLDGDGRVSALAFGDGEVRFTSRFVRSTKLVDEEAAGKPLYRTFGTAFPGDRLLHGASLASPANISVYRWNGELLALGEQGLPWALDPRTLETRGEHTFGCLSPVTPFSAHPHFDPASGEMLNFGVSFASRRPMLNLYRFAAGGELLYRRRLPLEQPCSLHDFSLGPRHAVFHLSPYLLDAGALLERGATVQDALSWQPRRGSHLLVIERETGEAVASVPVGDGYCLHQINAFDQQGRLVVDLVELPEPAYPQYQVMPDLFTTVPASRPVRLVVDLEAAELVERQAMDFSLAADFPSLDPRRKGAPYRHFWMLAISATGRPGRKFFDRLVRCDWQAGAQVDGYSAAPGCYLGGEPVVIGDPTAEEGGAVICQELDAARRRGVFLIFDALHLAAGPVARLPLPWPIPPGFHASFEPAEDRPR